MICAREDDVSLPLDPELYVASQPCETPFPDPWFDLTARGAVGCYRARVNEIVKRLRGELSGEVRYAEGRVGRGEALARVLLTRSRRLSPLGCFIVAHRAARPALANRFLHGAGEQHRACPLYREASAALLTANLYPVRDTAAAPPVLLAAPTGVRPRGQFHAN
ncbi:MAG: hypothetical protein LC745_00085 [Planctomycetia bacterium]|nr:hypothetical protein [Planctomycetia bacterium]